MANNSQQARFKGAPWLPQNEEPILIGGAGGIGSWVTFFLSRIGFSPFVYDFDVIEEHNLGGQLFRVKDIGRTKVMALQDIILDFCVDNLNIFNTPVDINTPTHHYVISAFDNMKARRDLFDVWKKSIPLCEQTSLIPIYIDGRLEMEQLQIFCVTPDKIEEYEKHLFADSKVPDAPCTMKQTSHSAAMIATLMTAFFTNHMTNVYAGKIIREVPFYYEYIIPMNLTISHNGD